MNKEITAQNDNLVDELRWRGLIYDATEGIEKIFTNERVTAYIGFDPSASSLHAGNLLTIMGLVRLQRFGHIPIAVAGGGTGLIGDPSGKTSERPMIAKDEVQANLEGVKEQLKRFLDFDCKSNPASVLNNADWLTTVSLTDFLRDVGKHFPVNTMIAKESIKRRLEQEGISFTEFSYLLLQAYDYLNLFEKYNCTLQMGGSDQWGNITAGVDLIRRIHGAKAHALVFPLLITATGAKFGKTESGAIWLDAKRTSPYRFYQFWLNSDDKDVINYLKYFTLLTQVEIEELAVSLTSRPEKREAHRELAREITRFVHGQVNLEKAEQASRVLFGAEMSDLSLEDALDIFADVPSVSIEKSQFSGDGASIVDLVTSSGLAKSKGESRRLIQGGGIYLNNCKINDLQYTVRLDDAIEGSILVLRKGTKEHRLIKLIE